jgi:arsenate reductase (thioredoxin)
MNTLFDALQYTTKQLDILLITEERKKVLKPLITFIQGRIMQQQDILLHFICTHNSRRSQTMAFAYNIPNVYCYSGGTEVTAVYPKIIETLQTNGFIIEKISNNENPMYTITYALNTLSIIAFSKKIDNPFNPKSSFAAIITCNSAYEACPVVHGATEHIAITFNDPKAFDNSTQQTEKYLERSLEIATEMKYVFENVVYNNR